MTIRSDSILPHASDGQAAPDGEVVISVKDVGKAYHLYDKPQDRLKNHLFARFGRQYGRSFWALRGVSFEIRRGEAVGILGRNGSGKSTLLQMLAGTLTPTEGTVETRGRVSALLELGSGFNPDYTGRANVFLNGAILGLSAAEVEARFDTIAAFADIGSFIDQPVKTYSSGMYARLAFSVAISVDPSILIVDEILSVGDYAFQQKCVAKMRQMRDGGLTLLFVSHGPEAIKSVCSKALLLKEGKPMYWGAAETAVNHYFNQIRQDTNREAIETQQDLATPVPIEKQVAGTMRYGTGHVQVEKLEVTDDRGEACRAFELHAYVNLHVTYRSYIDAENLSVSFLVRDLTGIDLTGTTTFDRRCPLPPLKAGESGHVRFRFPNVFRPGNFGLSVAINRVKQRDYSDGVLLDQVDGGAFFISSPHPEKPVHYKVDVPVEIILEDGGGSDRQ